MNKIVSVQEAIKISKQLKDEKKSIVLAGGVFDILHVGHARFLKAAKRQADFLFVLLESDEKVRRLKGRNRPINLQDERAEVLASLSSVNYIIKLPAFMKSKDYDDIITELKPDVLATTKGDPNLFHKKRQAKFLGAKLVYVTERIKTKSSTRIANLIEAKLAK